MIMGDDGGYELVGEERAEGEDGTAIKPEGLPPECRAHSARIIKSSLSPGTICCLSDIVRCFLDESVYERCNQ